MHAQVLCRAALCYAMLCCVVLCYTSASLDVVLQAGEWESALQKYNTSKEEEVAASAQAAMLESRAMSLAEGMVGTLVSECCVYGPSLFCDQCQHQGNEQALSQSKPNGAQLDPHNSV